MAILGVLLGITIGLLVGAVVALAVVGSQRSTELARLLKLSVDQVTELSDRVSAIERRKPVIAEPAAKPANLRRQWNENLPAVEG